jgi:hypothetical protein
MLDATNIPAALGIEGTVTGALSGIQNGIAGHD